MKGLPAGTIISDLPEGTRVWIVCSIERRSIVLTPDNVTGDPVLITLLKREDAEHYARILQEHAPAFQDKTLGILDVDLEKLVDELTKDKIHFLILSPNEAMKFFQEYGDLLPDYFN